MKTKEKNLSGNNSRHYLIRAVITIVLLIVGAVYIGFFMSVMQNRASEKKQLSSAEKILNEVSAIMHDNDTTTASIEAEYNALNQGTLTTIQAYLDDNNVLNLIGECTSDIEFDDVTYMLSINFGDLAEKMNVTYMYLVNDDGDVVASSAPEYRTTHLSDRGLFTENQIKTLTTYNATDEMTVNGTVTTYGETKTYSPVIFDVDGMTFYTYSTYFGMTSDYTGYYLLTTVDAHILETEFASISSISTVLKDITIGKDGFLFAFDPETKKLTYFNDGIHDYSGRDCSSMGISDALGQGEYTGYEEINGVRYYCHTHLFYSAASGEYMVIVAAVPSQELIGRNVSIIASSAIAYVIVSAIIAAYGMILRRDIANHIVSLERRHISQLQDEVDTGKAVFTKEEIQERTDIYIDDYISKNEDKHIKRKLIGTRNAKGVQGYLSLYLVKKIIPVLIVGLVAIFAISFYAQTLVALQDAINVSKDRISEVSNTLDKNQRTTESIEAYVDEQYENKASLVAFLAEQYEESITDDAVAGLSEQRHPVYQKDKNGDKQYVLDSYDNILYSTENNSVLKSICDQNGFNAIYIYNEDGYCISTSTSNWFYTLRDSSDRSYILNDVIDGKKTFVAEDAAYGDDTISDQFFGYSYEYYTYNDGGVTNYASKSEYQNYVYRGIGDHAIERHVACMAIVVDTAQFHEMFEVTKLSYILNNTHVYGEDSFFLAFDTSDDHKLLYSPTSTSIGKTASELGIDEKAFSYSDGYNGFQKINGVEYYQTYLLVGDYYFATAIPTESLYDTRNQISLYTLLFSAVFLLIGAGFYMFSNSRDDLEYINHVKATQGSKDEKKNVFGLAHSKKKNAIDRSLNFWELQTVEQKLNTILMGYLTLASVLIVIMLIMTVTSSSDSTIFSYILSGNWEKGFNIFAITESLMILTLIATFSTLAKMIVKAFCGSLGSRVETLGNLIVSVIQYGGIIGGFFYCLYLFGFDTASLLASAGILTIVVGLGAQSLISDILAGMFIVFEGEFRVGDIVTIGDFRGTVVEIGLRTTKLKDASGNLKIFNNSSISGVLNMTKEHSVAAVTVCISYDESVEKVENILRNGFPDIRKKLPAIIDGPFYKGISELADSSVNMKIIAMCEEKDRMQLVRDLNREFFLLFVKNNVNVPYNQLTISYAKDIAADLASTEEDAQRAQEFVDRQRNAIQQNHADDDQGK